MKNIVFFEKLSKSQISRCILGMASVIMLIVGIINGGFNLLLISMTLLLCHNIVYAFEDIRERLLFLIIHITIFTFLISRSLIGMFRGESWWTASSQAAENVYASIYFIWISMSMLWIGAIGGRVYAEKKTGIIAKKDNEKRENFRIHLQIVAEIVFYSTMCFFLIQEGEKLLYMLGKTYTEYYVSFHSQLPGIIYTIASFMKYSLCIFLATFPSKKRAFIPLALYVISAIPELIIGVRNPIMLNCLFVFLYYAIRDICRDKEKWIGRVEKILTCIVAPASLIFMTVYAYIRSGLGIANRNIFQLFMDFFYGQGVTFNVLGIGYGYQTSLPERVGRNYTFGGIIDYIVHGRIGQMLWGTQGLPDGNNIINGVESNSLAHNLAYVTRTEDYLKGQGWGTSYMLENYIDFGYVGLIIFNLVLGFLFIYMLRRFEKNMLVDTITLIALTSIFFIPRAEATGWLTFIVTIQFWACVIACYLGAYICTKCRWLQNILKMLHLYPKCKN